MDNDAGSIFGKKLEVLEVMAMIKTYEIMFDLECDGLILQMFQCFFNIKEHHPNTIIAHMRSIFYLVMGDRDTI